MQHVHHKKCSWTVLWVCIYTTEVSTCCTVLKVCTYSQLQVHRVRNKHFGWSCGSTAIEISLSAHGVVLTARPWGGDLSYFPPKVQSVEYASGT